MIYWLNWAAGEAYSGVKTKVELPCLQGYIPDGILTYPSDAAMLNDLLFMQALGHNTIRKHIKVLHATISPPPQIGTAATPRP